jgi:putative MATE family efflux protein
MVSDDRRGALAREVRALALPAIAHSLLQTLVFVVDRAMLGHHSETSLAAMQIAGPLEWSIWSVFSAFTVGTMARVGRHVGAGDRRTARLAVFASFGFAAAFGVALACGTPLLLASLRPLFPDASAAAHAAARDYLTLTIGASPAVFVGATAIAALQASGDTRTPLFIGLYINVQHVAMNRVLILGAFGIPALGPKGAGISTAITFTCEAILACLALASRTRSVSLRARPEDEAISRRALAREAREVANVATPALAERVLYHLGYLGFSWVIGRLGDVAMAANQALISIESICFLSADGFGIAAAALVAQKLGAGDAEAAARAARLSARYAAVLLTTLGLVFLATRSVTLPLFSDDAHVLALGAATMPVLAIAQPFMAIATVLAQAFRGAGKTRVAFGVSATCAFVVRLVVTYVAALPFGLGLVGVWLGSTADWVARTVLLVFIGRAWTRTHLERGAPAG